MWSIEYEYIVPWLDKQDSGTVEGIFAALEQLEQFGPALGRPLVDTLTGTEVRNLKELRPASPGRTEVRILFAFDPKRQAVMLFAGDKSKGRNGKGRWSGWYKNAIPLAEKMYQDHVRMLGGDDGQSCQLPG